MDSSTGRFIKITIDGRDVNALPGKTILQTLQTEGIDIPHLCHDTRLAKPNSNCGLCVVELEGEDRFVKSCETPVLDGMRIITTNDKIEAYRRVRLEQVLSDHNADCVAPCVQTCPANIDIQAYLRQVADGNFNTALRIIKERNPFPMACGRVCPHPCEAECRRVLVDDAVAINYVKRFVADYDMLECDPYIPKKKPSTGKKIAIVGAGPAGLSAAYYSAINGHSVTVYEQQPESGGMMRYGIPEYRYPKKTLDLEVDIMKKLGVEIKNGKKLGTHIRLEELNKAYDAVMLAVGSWKPNSMRVEGERSKGVWLGIEFLESVTLGEKVEVGKEVIVIGGGNTAIDCSRTAKRLGANVKLIYRRTKDEMPAEAFEVHEADEEGIEMIFLAAPTKVVTDASGNVKGVQFIKMELGEPDRSGRRKVTPIENSEYEVACNCVIGAIGQSTDVSFLFNDSPVKLNQWGDIEINGKTMQTSDPKVFSAGDCVTGPATVVQAVGAGRVAAECIDEFVLTGKVTDLTKDYSCSRGTLEDLPKFEFEIKPKLSRAKMNAISLKAREKNFDEVETGLKQQQAIDEAARCLKCGCTERYDCDLRDCASNHNITHKKHLHELSYIPVVTDHPYIMRDHNKCVLCGRCIAVCKDLEGPGVLDFYMKEGKLRVGTRSGAPLEKTECVNCGQCVATCPCGALSIKSDIDKVFKAINDPEITVVGFMAPAVRTVIADRFGLPSDKATAFTGGMLKALGVDKVFDVNFTADLTILEEASEFIGRLTNKGVLPQFTSCCPGWVTYVEKKYSEFIPNLSSCKSPQQMLGALMKSHFPQVEKIDRKKVFSVSVMPCIAKKFEADRPEFTVDGVKDIDAVITTTELIEMIKLCKLEDKIFPVEFDRPYEQASGAACLFGVTGGVCEAALRMAADVVTGTKVENLDYQAVRGLEGIKEAVVELNGLKIKVAVVNSLKNAEPIMEAMKKGVDLGYHLIEVMACPGGCIDGAGQPVPTESRELTRRKDLIFDIDKNLDLRKSQENPDIISLYDTFFGKPNSELAHKLLHTHYHAVKTENCVVDRDESAFHVKQISVCIDKHCASKGSFAILQELASKVKEHKLDNYIAVKPQLCKGHCKEHGVFVSVDGKKINEADLKNLDLFIDNLVKSK